MFDRTIPARATRVRDEGAGTIANKRRYPGTSFTRNALRPAKSLKAGHEVGWNSSGGHSTGKVVEKVTAPTQIKGHKVAASKDNPEYIVRSDKSGKIAAHKPGSLTKAAK